MIAIVIKIPIIFDTFTEANNISANTKISIIIIYAYRVKKFTAVRDWFIDVSE